mgnify:CR=1 FL=1
MNHDDSDRTNQLRSVRTEEIELWRKVAQSVKPLKTSSRAKHSRIRSVGIETAIPVGAKLRSILSQSVAKSRGSQDKVQLIDSNSGTSQKARKSKELTAQVQLQRTETVFSAPDFNFHQKQIFDHRQRRQIARVALSSILTLDLHGMTQQSAHRRLNVFIREAYESDIRLVLVITGKGERSKKSHGEESFLSPGILRRKIGRAHV